MTKSSIVQVGFKKGKLLIIESLQDKYVEPNGHRRSMVKVRCDCGIEYVTRVDNIVKAKYPLCQNCKYALLREYNVGDIFGDLTIIEIIETNHKMVICKCLCENMIKVRGDLLKKRKDTHCGQCKNKSIWKGTNIVSSSLFSRIRRNAYIRNIDFNITIEDISKLYETQCGKCALTGLPIYLAKNKYEESTGSLDRINSQKSYIIENVQWIHKDINLMKMDLDESRFF